MAEHVAEVFFNPRACGCGRPVLGPDLVIDFCALEADPGGCLDADTGRVAARFQDRTTGACQSKIPASGIAWGSAAFSGMGGFVPVVGAFLEGAFCVHEDAHVRVCVVQPPGADPESRL
jgi:hypothetical protein